MKIEASLIGLQLPMVVAMMIANEVMKELDQEFRNTSNADGEHSVASLHYTGNAIDVGLRYVPRQVWETARERIAHRLGKEFDVVLEPSKNHIHIEFQPKTGMNLGRY